MKPVVFYLVCLILFPISAYSTAKSNARFGVNCYETNGRYVFDEKTTGKITVLDTVQTLVNGDSYKFSFEKHALLRIQLL